MRGNSVLLMKLWGVIAAMVPSEVAAFVGLLHDIRLVLVGGRGSGLRRR